MKVFVLFAVIILQIVFLTHAEARGGGRGGGGKSYHSFGSHGHSSKSRSGGYRGSGSSSEGSSGSCPCSGSNDCVGPRGGTYCYTSGGNKRYR